MANHFPSARATKSLETNVYNFSDVLLGFFGLIVAVLAVYIPYRLHKEKYKIVMSVSVSKGTYSPVSQAFLTELTLNNAGEIPVRVKVKYIGTLTFHCGSIHQVSTPDYECVVDSGASSQMDIPLITGGLKGKANLIVQYTASNTGGKESIFTKRVDEFNV